MQINCPHCQHKAHIASRNNLNDEKTIADLYCNCSNPACAARFVMQLGFQRWINPPVTNTLELAASLIGKLSKADRVALLKEFG
ncbi:Ogr/Delta-like zinc finger protein [Methylomonas albis]|uniref:Ogr/Delta-like zinc finger family protein n=1 Tax=Methylomonas albis TaxID=1854563 RepID=A0ABR9D1Q9_9GAMM|nr:ogr/Delta-like zinc finger family protein [Methylomonas albis]MBD9356970.1 ogr/Delta-like zinc finger family protein [Methylomonas albis]